MPMISFVFISLFVCAACAQANSCASEGHTLLQVGRGAKPHSLVEEGPDFKVLAVGAPRTGTQSLSKALTRLGYNPLHSGENLNARAPWCNHIFGKASFEEAMLTMKGFDSALDEPFHLMYEEVMQRFPDCKFILTESDPDKWYSSCRNFASNHLVTAELEGLTRDVSNACQNLHYFGCDFTADETPQGKERCLEGYRSHAMRVKQLVPPEKLLIFNLADGYRPLAEFLGKAVPDEPFPYEDHFVAEFLDKPVPDGQLPYEEHYALHTKA